MDVDHDVNIHRSIKRSRDIDDTVNNTPKITRIGNSSYDDYDDDDDDILYDDILYDDDGNRIDADEENSSLNEKLDTLDKNYTDASNTIDILNTLKSYNTNTDDNKNTDDNDKQMVIVNDTPPDVNTVNDITNKFRDFCSELVYTIQQIIASNDYTNFKTHYKAYLDLKKKQGDKNPDVISKFESYNSILNNIFDEIKELMRANYHTIYDDDPRENEFNNRLFVCFNKNQDNKKLLNKNKALLKSNREFIKLFLEYFGTQNKQNDENASRSSFGTKSTFLPTITSQFEVPAGNTYIQNGIDLNEMLKNNYLTRVKYNLYETNNLNIKIENNNWNYIKTQIDGSFNTFIASVFNIIKDNSANDLPMYIKEVYEKEKLTYKQKKFIIDVGDLMHDVFKIPVSSDNSYFQGIKLLASKLLGNSSESIIIELENCYANTIIQINGNYYKNLNQGKTHDMRTEAITNLKNKIVETNNKLLLPNIETRLLGQREGYFELIKHIYTISIDNKPTRFVYSESGRILSIKDIADYYDNLDPENKEEFITECINYCDYDDDKKNTIIQLLSTPKPDIQSIQVELLPITSFDGCGASSNITNKEPGIAPSIFDNVFGYYNYTVYTVYDMDTKYFNHLVVVKIQDNEQDQSIQAIFGFWGNITINMLLKSVGIPLSRPGEGDKGGLISIATVNNVLIKKEFDLSRIYQGLDSINFSDSCYYAQSITNIGLKKLLLLGNKTIGDLIFTTYTGVYSVSTVDSFIGDSTMYNFLSGNSDILQSVWMQTGGKGWKYTPGLFKEDINSKAIFISTQLLSSLMFLKAFSKFIDTSSSSSSSQRLSVIREEEYDENSVNHSQYSEAPSINEYQDGPLKNLITNYDKIIQVITNIDCSAIEPLERFNTLMNYILSDFDNIKNYTSADNIYNTCMVQLLIYENYSIKRRIFEYIKKLSEYIDNYYKDNSESTKNTTFLNNIYTLPKLDTFFISNISTLASNNSESYNINDLFKLAPSYDDNFINIKINNTYIDFSYNAINVIPTKDTPENQGYLKSEIDYNPEGGIKIKENVFTPLKSSNDAPVEHPILNLHEYKYPINVKIPYTIESLINLHLTNKLKDTDKSAIKNRIVSFFKNSIDSIQPDNPDITPEIYINLNEIFKKVNILDASDNLQNINSVDFNDDEEDCGKCADGVSCSKTNDDNTNANANNANTNANMETAGGTRKKNHKQPKKYKSYNHKTNRKTNRKSKKHNKSKNNRKPKKSQRKHR